MSNPLIGIIAEDESDVECVKVIVRKLQPTKKIGFKRFVGHGCGKISRKANAWAHQFLRLKCNSLILIHDLDRNNVTELKAKINASFLPSPISNYVISIPIEELEAWLLSDTNAIAKTFGITKRIKLPYAPEKIESPKEFLEDFIWQKTEKRHTYLNTQHNHKIVENMDIGVLRRKCPSFRDLDDFIVKL